MANIGWLLITTLSLMLLLACSGDGSGYAGAPTLTEESAPQSAALAVTPTSPLPLIDTPFPTSTATATTPLITPTVAAPLSLVPTPLASDTAAIDRPSRKATPEATPVSSIGVSYNARDVSAISLTTPQLGGAAYGHFEIPTVEAVLEEGHPLVPGVSPVHIAFRGTAEPNSTRCVWVAVARTVEQREGMIRAWFGLDAEAPLPAPEEIVSQSMAYINEMVPYVRPSMLASVESMAYGGLSSDYGFLTCYVSYRVTDHFLGSSATKLTVAYDLRISGASYELYRSSHAAGEFGDEPLMSKSEYEASLNEQLREYEERYNEILRDRESVVFLVPMGAYQAIAVEAWLVAEQWDVQLVDGVLQAVRYGAGDHDAEYTQTLDNLKSRITTAAASDKFAGKRIASTEGLEAYYREIGAYDDITPGDGLDNPFTPAQPPPVPPCATGGAVADPGANRHQVHDCQALLAAQEALGGAALNWSPALPLPIWDGVTMDGPDGSVVKLDLSCRGLAGVLPPELGRLYGLEELWLRNNRLSGAIPPALGLLGGLQYLVLDGNRLSGAVPSELGELESLEGLRLSGNELSGCLPAGLRAVEDSDLAGMGLRYCDRIPPPPTGFRGAPYFRGSVQLNWDAMPGVDAYQVQRLVEGGVGGWYRAGPDLTGILFGNSYNFGPGCGRHYQYRVLSRGDGQTYDAVWSAPSEAISVPTNPCP